VTLSGYEYVGSIHLHTTASDGAATHQEVTRLASLAGLDFVVVTDHNVLTGGVEGWYEDCLLLVGEEINDTKRVPQANHLLAFDVEKHVPGDDRTPQEVIDAVNAQGGFGFIAHPFEYSPPFTQEPELPWLDWEASGYAGLEIWNYMSEFKSYLHDARRALFLVLFPSFAITHRQTAAIAGTDVHGNTYNLGPLRRAILSYEHCFRAVRTHIIAPQPLRRELKRDRALVYQALKNGSCFVAYDAIGDSRGFRFTASSSESSVGMGGEISLLGDVEVEITSPVNAELRLLRDGQVAARGRGKRLQYVAQEAGVYRVEARRRYLFKSRSWVFTNPIYVRA
jgi:hypothetical protein